AVPSPPTHACADNTCVTTPDRQSSGHHTIRPQVLLDSDQQPRDDIVGVPQAPTDLTADVHDDERVALGIVGVEGIEVFVGEDVELGLLAGWDLGRASLDVDQAHLAEAVAGTETRQASRGSLPLPLLGHLDLPGPDDEHLPARFAFGADDLARVVMTHLDQLEELVGRPVREGPEHRDREEEPLRLRMQRWVHGWPSVETYTTDGGTLPRGAVRH